MKMSRLLLVFLFVFFQMPSCFAADFVNFSFLPDPASHCHQYGVDVAITKNSTLGVLMAPECNSDRATYGLSNNNVSSKFSRVMIPWRYASHGAFHDGYFIDAAIGAEQSEFKSVAGSRANVSFIDVVFHVGYQWFWDSGVNVTALVGPGFLVLNNVDKTVSTTESADVIDFLDKNTKTNAHIGWGIVFGWAF